MYELKDNEVATPAMFYTANALFHGEVITTKVVRVNIWLRSDSAPNFIHLLNAEMISLTGSGQTMKLNEAFLPTDSVIAYHTAPGVEIKLDYTGNEPNRRMMPIKLVGSSLLTIVGENRISTQTELGTTLEVGRTSWLSLYNIAVSTPNIPKMRLEAPMILIRPEAFTFAPLD